MRAMILVAAMVAGCADDKTCTVSDLGDAVATASLDGKDWQADQGTWSFAGSAIQASLESAVELNVTLRATVSEEGDAVAERIEAGDLPVTIDLSGADGHGGVMDLRNGIDAYASNKPGGSGTMTIVSATDGGELHACFEFDAVNPSTGQVIELREGRVTISQ